MAFNRRYAARRIQRAWRRRRAMRGMRYAARKRVAVSRLAITKNPEPTFVETFKPSTDSFVVGTGAGVGQVFKVRISDIPQVGQYANLYKQYRINWVKVMLLPEWNTESDDKNAGIFNESAPVLLPSAGNARIVYSIQDSPGVVLPATEQDVLLDNGCKIKSIGKKWSCSFKPVPDVQQVTTVGNIYTRQKYRQWFNFDLVTTGNNPEHGAVTAFVTLPGVGGSSIRYHIYYKVSFTLRDPQ